MNRMLLTGILLAVLPAVAVSAFACSCIGWPGTVMEEFERADTVFLGSVMTVVQPSGWNNLLVEIQVEKVWKGDPGAVVLIITELSSAACGIEFQPDQAWVVFATDIVHQGEIGFYTHLCTLTTHEDYAAGIMAELGPTPVRNLTWGTLKSRYR